MDYRRGAIRRRQRAGKTGVEFPVLKADAPVQTRCGSTM
jgi:hypothetical protein